MACRYYTLVTKYKFLAPFPFLCLCVLRKYDVPVFLGSLSVRTVVVRGTGTLPYYRTLITINILSYIRTMVPRS